MIKTYSYKDNNIYDLLLSHINENKPCIITNFLEKSNNKDIKYIKNSKLKARIFIEKNSPECSINNLTNFSKYTKYSKCTIYQCENNSNKHLKCYNSLLYKLMNNKRFIFYGENQPYGTRIWNDNKGKFTTDHYDAPGQSVFNISLKGKKKFQLAKPNTFKNYPLSSVTIFADSSKYDYEFILNPGCLLYIPPFWHHQVTTLENNTQNFNLTFYDHKQINNVTNRNLAYLMIHKIFNTIIWKNSENDKTFKNVNSYSYNTLKYFIYEFGHIAVILFLILYYFKFSYKTLLMSTLALLLLDSKKFAYESGGYSQLLIRILNIIFFTYILFKFYKKS